MANPDPQLIAELRFLIEQGEASGYVQSQNHKSIFDQINEELDAKSDHSTNPQ